MYFTNKNGKKIHAYTAEERSLALDTSLTALAASMGYTPARSGSHYYLKEMDSLIIYNDKSWKRWSEKGIRNGGTQIDFLLEFGNISSVPEAINYLLAFAGKESVEARNNHTAENSAAQIRPDREKEKREFVLPEKNRDCRRLYAYLIKTRGLSEQVVTHFMKQGLIYEDAAHHNVVFVGRDPQGKARYAGLRGTADIYGKKFKMDVPGNDKNYGVNIVNQDSSELKVFESVIDCMSYMDITGDYKSNKLVLGMVADNPLEQFLKDYSHIKHICFCLDNDIAGRKAIYGGQAGDGQPERKKCGLKEKYEQKGCKVSVELVPEGCGKDYNEYLGYLKQRAASESREGQNVITQKRRGR